MGAEHSTRARLGAADGERRAHPRQPGDGHGIARGDEAGRCACRPAGDRRSHLDHPPGQEHRPRQLQPVSLAEIRGQVCRVRRTGSSDLGRRLGADRRRDRGVPDRSAAPRLTPIARWPRSCSRTSSRRRSKHPKSATSAGAHSWTSRRSSGPRSIIRRPSDQDVGDGFLAVFEGPAKAIRAAHAMGEAVRALGVEIRAGFTPASASGETRTSRHRRQRGGPHRRACRCR